MEFAYLSINKGILIINSTLDACDLVLTYSFFVSNDIIESDAPPRIFEANMEPLLNGNPF